MDNRYGYKENDLVVVAEPGAVPAKDCTMAGVTGVPGGGQSDNIIHNSGGGGSAAAIYNKPGGLGVTYVAGASVINLGPAPTVNVYSILSNSLALQARLGVTAAAAATTPIVDGIVQLQARYGRDTTVPTADGVIDVWDTTTPVAAADWSRPG